jgi:hypothetical protein
MIPANYFQRFADLPCTLTKHHLSTPTKLNMKIQMFLSGRKLFSAIGGQLFPRAAMTDVPAHKVNVLLPVWRWHTAFTGKSPRPQNCHLA